MRNRFDQLAKQLLQTLLASCGSVEIEHEVTASPQSIDLTFVPDLAHGAQRGRLGLLGRLASNPSLFEPFSGAPGLAEVRGCVRKQLTWHHGLSLVGRGADEPPWLWVLAAGEPRQVLTGFDLRHEAQWPPGVWVSVPASRFGVVVLSQLPREEDTLLLRLMGRGPTLEEAIDDLQSLPQDAWQRLLVVPILVRLRFEILEMDEKDPEMEEFLMRTQESFESFCERTRREGLLQGLEKGLEKGLEQGQRELVAQLMRQKFGEELTDRVLPLLVRLPSGSALTQVGVWLMEASQPEAFLEKVEALVEAF